MKINVHDELQWLQSLSVAERATFLAALAHNLTIAARVLCHSNANPNEALERVCLANEISHRITGYVLHHHIADEDAGWLPVVVEHALGSQDSVIHQQAQQAWSYAKKVIIGASAA